MFSWPKCTSTNAPHGLTPRYVTGSPYETQQPLSHCQHVCIYLACITSTHPRLHSSPATVSSTREAGSRDCATVHRLLMLALTYGAVRMLKILTLNVSLSGSVQVAQGFIPICGPELQVIPHVSLLSTLLLYQKIETAPSPRRGYFTQCKRAEQLPSPRTVR